MSQTNNEIVLGYWAIRGLVEPIRLALQYAKTPYTDKLYVQGEGPEFSREDWLQEKEKLGLDFPNLPYIFHGDVKITQSKAILYYLGRQLNLMGANPTEEAFVMMLCEEAHDLRFQTNSVFYSPKGESKDERKQFVETTLNTAFKKFDDYLGKTKTKFAVGNQPTIADFQVYEYLDASLAIDEDNTLLEKYSNVKQFLNTIRELPQIKDYIATAHAQLPLNNKVARLGGKVIQRK